MYKKFTRTHPTLKLMFKIRVMFKIRGNFRVKISVKDRKIETNRVKKKKLFNKTIQYKKN